jgi:hypothetical protein
MAILDLPELARKPAGFLRQLTERHVLDAVLAAHLLDHQLRVGHDLDGGKLQLDRLPQAGDQPAVLGDVVGREPDRLALGREDGAVLVLEHEAVGGRTGVAACSAVGEESRRYDAGDSALSICARCSLPL